MFLVDLIIVGRFFIIQPVANYNANPLKWSIFKKARFNNRAFDFISHTIGRGGILFCGNFRLGQRDPRKNELSILTHDRYLFKELPGGRLPYSRS